ncbi:MAG: acyl carrier protein, partial [Pseudomonadota bacterium]
QPPSELDPKKPLTEMGFDSLMAVDLKMAVEEKIGANLPMMALSEGVSLAALSRKLLDEARGEAQAAVLEESVMEVAGQHMATDVKAEDKVVAAKIAKRAKELKSS